MDTLSQDHNATDRPFKSIGYRTHNELTYRGVDFLLNSTIGVAFTYFGARTHIGQHYYSRPLSGVYEKLLTPLKPILGSEKHIKEGAEWGMLFTSIIVGGTAIVPIMMGLENKNVKKSIIHKIDKLAYGKEFVDSHEEFKEQDTRVDTEAKKDFTTGMLARGVALAPMIAATVHTPTNQWLVDNYYNHIGKVSKFAAEDLKFVSNSTIKKLKSVGQLELVNGQEKMVNNWEFIHRTIGFDLGLTFIYSFLHEVAYKGLASNKQRHGDHFHGMDADTIEATTITENDKPESKLSLTQPPARSRLNAASGEVFDALSL